MDMTSTRAALVDRDFSDGVTATLPRAEFESALASDEPAELILEVTRPGSGETGDVAVSWNREELERLLAGSSGPTVSLTFSRDELEAAFDPEVEMHGIREKALILSVATAAAFGGASTAAAATHDEQGLTARGITPSYLAIHDEATLADRGIEPLAAATHDEATLAARGIDAASLPASHDEATLAARGIAPVVAATHDEATLTARGIDPASLPASHDEATLTARGITPAAPAESASVAVDTPTVDPSTVAAVGAGAAGLLLAITAAGFAIRRHGTAHPV